MEQAAIVSGLSELKDILIRAYRIDRERSSIRLYFTQSKGHLFMHEYSDHKKTVILVNKIEAKYIVDFPEKGAMSLVKESLNHVQPDQFLNEAFLLYGYFRF